MPFNLHGSRIITLVPENKKYEYRINIFRLLYDNGCQEEVPLQHLLCKVHDPAHSIPQEYKKIFKKYGFYNNGAYIIDSTIIKSAFTEYLTTDTDDNISDVEPEEMPRD